MSSYEIANKIKLETKISYSNRQIINWLKRFNIGRNLEEALQNRVFTGRMDYKKRDTSARYIDYTKRDLKIGYLWSTKLFQLLPDDESCLRLAKHIGTTKNRIISWKLLRNRVHPKFQELISLYFNLDIADIFSNVKDVEHPVRKRFTLVNHRKILINKGYKYATPLLKTYMYKNHITVTSLSKTLNKHAGDVSILLNGKKLASPSTQERIFAYLQNNNSAFFKDTANTL